MKKYNIKKFKTINDYLSYLNHLYYRRRKLTDMLYNLEGNDNEIFYCLKNIINEIEKTKIIIKKLNDFVN